jgi:uncharacterized repeat protein (TIGR01451 family)
VQIENAADVADDGCTEKIRRRTTTTTDVTPLVAGPDLNITKDDGVDFAAAGSTLSYSLAFANVGDQGATGVVIRDTVPPNTHFAAAASDPSWSCGDPDGPGPLVGGDPGSACVLIPNVGFGPGVLPAGSGGTVVFTLIVDDPLPGGVDQILNAASIEDDGTNGEDPTPEDNTDDDLDSILESGEDFVKALVATDQAHTSGCRSPLGILTYEVTINLPAAPAAPVEIDNVVLTDILQAGLAFVDCVSVSADPELSTSLGAFSEACNPPSNPLVQAEPPGSLPDLNKAGGWCSHWATSLRPLRAGGDRHSLPGRRARRCARRARNDAQQPRRADVAGRRFRRWTGGHGG